MTSFSAAAAVKKAFVRADFLASSSPEEEEADHRRHFVLERSSTDIDYTREEEDDEGPRRMHLVLERSLTAPDEEEDRRYRRRWEALERRRRESGAIQARIWRSYSLRSSSWDTNSAVAGASAAAVLLRNIQRGKESGCDAGGRVEEACQAVENTPAIAHVEDYDDSQDLTGYSEDESESESEFETATKTEIEIDAEKKMRCEHGKIEDDVPNSSTDLTDAETTGSEPSRSSSSASDHLSEWDVLGTAQKSARRQRQNSRRSANRKHSEMTHITECSSESSDNGANFIPQASDDDSDDGYEGRVRNKSSSFGVERRRRRIRIVESNDDDSFDIPRGQVLTVPEKSTDLDLVRKEIIAATTPSGEVGANSSRSDSLGVDVAFADDEEEQREIRDRLGIAPPRRPPFEDKASEKKAQLRSLIHMAEDEEEGKQDDTESTNKNDSKAAKRPKKGRRKKKRRQRLNMRWAAGDSDADATHESGGFELDLMAPSDSDSSFHSKASTANLGGGDLLDSSRHSHRCRGAFLDSSCHSRGRPPNLLRWSRGSKNKLRHSPGSSGMHQSGSLLSLSSQNSASNNILVAPPLTTLGRGCSQASMFFDDTSVGYDAQDNFLDFSIRDFTGIIPEIKKNISADDLKSLAAAGADDEDVDESQQPLFCSAPDGGRFLLLGASLIDDESAGLHVLSPPLAEALRSQLPFAVSGQNFWLKYSLVQHGASLETLLDNVPADAHTILAVETNEGEVFGSFTSSPWRKDWNYYGSGFGAFLWRMKGSRGGEAAAAHAPSSTCSGEQASPPIRHWSFFDQAKAEGDINVFKWSGRNDFIQLLTSEKMAVGGGAEKVADWLTTDSSSLTTAPGFGLCIDDGMFQGTSSPCATFESPPLSRIHSDGSPFNILNVEVWALTPCISVEEALKMEAMKTFHAAMRSSARNVP